MGRGTDMENSVILKVASRSNWEGNFFFLNNAIFFYVMVSLGHPSTS